MLVGSMLAISSGMAQRSPAIVETASATASNPQVASATADVNAVLGRKLSIDLHSVPLRDAIAAVAKQSDVRIHYQVELVEAPKRQVTLRASDKTLGAVLSEMLEGTSLHALVVAPGVLALQPTGPRRTDGVIIGKVIHAKTKQPLAGVTIMLDGMIQKGGSGTNGEFRLAVPPGERRLAVRMVGFVRQERVVAVADGETIRVDIVLEPSASVLDEVIVTGTVVATERKAIPNPITVITAEDIERRGITRIEQFFRGEVPGVVALETGSQIYNAGEPGVASALGQINTAQVYTRGASNFVDSRGMGAPSSMKTYIDGVELFDPSYLGTLDPKSIERIEIVAGPQAATIYGSGAMGGVMQIFLKKGSGRSIPDLVVSGRYGLLQSNVSNGLTPLHNYSSTLSGGNGADLSYSLNASYDYSGQWQPELFRRFWGGQIGAVFVYHTIAINGSYAVTGTENGTSSRAFTSEAILQRQKRASGEWIISPYRQNYRKATSNNHMVSLTADYQANPFWLHSGAVGRVQNRFSMNAKAPTLNTIADTLFGSAIGNAYRTTYSYSTTIVRRSWKNVVANITFGVNGARGERVDIDGCLISNLATSYVTCPPYLSVMTSRPVGDRTWGGFSSWQVGIYEKLFLTFGLRGERNPSYGKNVGANWTPTTGAAFTIERGELTLKLLASYGRSTRPPSSGMWLERVTITPDWDPAQYVSRWANPELTPEFSRGPQGGVELYFGNLGSLTVNRYSQRVSDLIQQVAVDSILRVNRSTGNEAITEINQYQNIADIRQHGWEMTGSINMGRLAIKGAYSWMDSRVIYTSPLFLYWRTYYPGMQFTNLPSHTASSTFSYAAGPTQTSVVISYIGASNQSILNSVVREDGLSSRLPMYVARKGWSGNNSHYHSPGYVKSDFSITQRITPKLSLTGNIVNLGNSFGSDVGEFDPVLGRQSMFGLSYRLGR